MLYQQIEIIAAQLGVVEVGSRGDVELFVKGEDITKLSPKKLKNLSLA